MRGIERSGRIRSKDAGPVGRHLVFVLLGLALSTGRTTLTPAAVRIESDWALLGSADSVGSGSGEVEKRRAVWTRPGGGAGRTASARGITAVARSAPSRGGGGEDPKPTRWDTAPRCRRRRRRRRRRCRLRGEDPETLCRSSSGKTSTRKLGMTRLVPFRDCSRSRPRRSMRVAARRLPPSLAPATTLTWPAIAGA